MKTLKWTALPLALVLVLLCLQPAFADNYTDTIAVFKKAEAVKPFFGNNYGYAVFPTVGKGGFVIGGAYGKGQVYAKGVVTGTVSLVKGSIGFQLGGQAFSQMIFFEDKRAFDEFTGGNFEFSADAKAVAITAAAGGSAGTTGSSAGASGGKKDATTKGSYHKGMATFTITKGGLIYEAVVAGQKFSYTPK